MSSGTAKTKRSLSDYFNASHLRLDTWHSLKHLSAQLAESAEAGDSHERLREKVNAMLQDFLSPPLYASSWSRGFGTLYTALYRPLNGSLELCWPDTRLSFSTSEFVESDHELYFGDERRQRAAV